MSIMSKILPLCFLPLGFSLLLMIFGMVMRRWLPVWFGVLLLWVFSLPVVGDALMRGMEGSARRVPVGQVVPAEAIVVLGGMMRQPEGAPQGEWSEAADRFDAGVRLYLAGKAPRLAFAGGQWPWQPDMVPEGNLLARRAVEAGVPATSIMVTGPVGNTIEEARAFRGMFLAGQGMPRHRIILVTSAFHMQRAAVLFEREGFVVERFPVDYRTNARERLTLLSFLPEAETLWDSSTALHELMGRWYLRTF